jgi:hypothetical protein
MPFSDVQKAVLRTALDIFVLDNAFFHIEGHPPSSYRVLFGHRLRRESRGF